MGGPQDKKAPVLIQSVPKNNQKNFRGKSFELEFDEYVQLKNANEEVLITPSVGKKSKIIAKKNRVIIIPEKSLQENTTYTVNFRDAVQDLSERNPAYNLRLAFSTGAEIDSLELVGSVNELFKEQPPDKITVAIYQRDTFNIFNHMPTYFTKTNEKGQFNITNLKAGEYYIYAFDDKNKNLKVDSKTERFGFLESQIVLNGKKIDSVKIPLVRVDARPLKLTSIRNTNRQSKIRFNKALDSAYIESRDYELNYQYAEAKDELLIFNPPKTDSIQVSIYARDSVGNTIDATAYIKTNNTKLPSDIFTIKLEEATYNIENQYMSVEGSFNKPLLGFNLDSLYIQLDTTQFIQITKDDITIDPVKHRLRIKKELKIKEDKSKSKKSIPVLVAGKGWALSLEQDSAKSHIGSIKVMREEGTGSLSINVDTKTPNYILQLINSRGVVVKSIMRPKSHVFKNLVPEEYKIRIVVDKNNNGRWDVGSYERKVEPEPVILFRNFEKKFSTPVRANWEVGPLNIRF
jgi:uncharacterized protein (DUF2141 family)